MPKRTYLASSSSAKTANGNGNGVAVVGPNVSCSVNVTAVSGTTPNLVVGLQWSNDSVTWYDADPADVMTAITATGAKVKQFVAKGNFCRPTWTITGTTPSFTFDVNIYSIV